MSAQKLRSFFDSWISTIGLSWSSHNFEALKPVIEGTIETVIDLLYNHQLLVGLSSKYDKNEDKQSVFHAASRLIIAIQFISNSKPGTDPANLVLPSGENVLNVLLQSIDKLLKEISVLPSAEEIRSIIAGNREAVMVDLLEEIMRNAQVPKWSQ
ncbi:MAG: hypothetical protein ACUZ8E_04950 [Candidatus Anammoxibacter sp.]